VAWPIRWNLFWRECVPKVPGRRYGLHDLGSKGNFVAMLA
jgi:hypothetical protein